MRNRDVLGSRQIEQLATMEPRLAQVVDFKYFSGFSFGDIAALWGISECTVQRDWEKARLFLHRALLEADGNQGGAEAPGSGNLPLQAPPTG